MTNEQLELSLAGGKQVAPPHNRASRVTRAAWWFGQMRKVVNSAMDWDRTPEPRPEQSWLGISHRSQSA